MLRRFEPKTADVSVLPKVSVLLSARNEVKDIGWKIEETLSWNYPADKLEMLVASDASEDGTDEILKGVTERRFRFIRLEKRSGKNEALNRLNKIATGDLLFFTDANSHVDPDCLQRAVKHFSDPRVGCVTGVEHTIQQGQDSPVTAGTGASLQYEGLVNTLESRLGSVLICDGSIFSMRKTLFATLQADLANDFELPAHIGAAGYAILYDPLVISNERSTSSPKEEFNRKRRICGQGILGAWRLRSAFRGLRAWQLFSRKFLRWLGAVPLFLILVSNILLVRIPFFEMMLVLQILFYSLALLGWWSASQRRKAGSLISFPFFLVMVHIAALVGVIEVMFGRRFSVWESPAASRGMSPVETAAGQRP
jgi:cellulose synthase/poly-beta-1,6-N-acetylglucosamine synthase-like glycosyltransferase